MKIKLKIGFNKVFFLNKLLYKILFYKKTNSNKFLILISVSNLKT